MVLSWDVVASRKNWSAELLQAIKTNKAVLDAGKMENFITGYQELSADLQIKCWAELIVAMAKFESDWNPHSIYHELPPLGVDSVGLLQLSYEDQNLYALEPLNREQRNLEDPLVNLRCGVKILAHLVAKDSVIADTIIVDNHRKYKGAARYWSVLREGDKHHLNDIRHLVQHNVGL
ncbi:transglycosylase SLT domain-containing protein [Spirosoma sp. HMF3257]|uniref:Transglycosylase SLT domain-containing protein n=1 Tax=Spirosoma telluris TaxID=2183553 RepID=A0A327NKJ7_9BACT|nr:transglycosylase SLT domain-containing protein [Spirosoma telluris]RAI75900.1 hypothetical protein HMF3257_20160 [Spirosoma telluris]